MLRKVLPVALLASASLASPSADATAVCQYLESQYPAYFAWDPKAKQWTASGHFAYDRVFMNPDPDMVQVDEATAMQAYPEAFEAEAEDLLAKFEKAASGLTEADGEVALSAHSHEDYRTLIALAEEIHDAQQ